MGKQSRRQREGKVLGPPVPRKSLADRLTDAAVEQPDGTVLVPSDLAREVGQSEAQADTRRAAMKRAIERGKPIGSGSMAPSLRTRRR